MKKSLKYAMVFLLFAASLAVISPKPVEANVYYGSSSLCDLVSQYNDPLASNFSLFGHKIRGTNDFTPNYNGKSLRTCKWQGKKSVRLKCSNTWNKWQLHYNSKASRGGTTVTSRVFNLTCDNLYRRYYPKSYSRSSQYFHVHVWNNWRGNTGGDGRGGTATMSFRSY